MTPNELEIIKDGNVLKVTLGARLDKTNAQDVSSQIKSNLDASITRIIFDAQNLKRITSDGLDVLLELRLSQRDVQIDNAGVGICDVFEAHGFKDVFAKVNKKYRFVSIKGCEEIGHGGHGTIYKVGEDTLVKVYRDNSPLNIIENERRFARNAFINGVPTAIAYDVVETENGYGVVFEMLGGITLGKYLEKHPDKLEEYGIKFTDLLYKLNNTDADPDLFPDFHQVYLDRAENARYLLGNGVEKIKKVINTIPRGHGMIHGDFHPNNVMIDADGELMLIDMADISRGNGFFDIGGTATILHYLPGVSYMKKKLHDITNLDGETCLKLWDIMLRRYYHTEDPEEISKYNKLCEGFSDLRMATSLGMKSSRSKLLETLLKYYTKWFIIPKTDYYIELFKSL